MLKTRFPLLIEDVAVGNTLSLEPQQDGGRLLAGFWVGAFVVAAYLIYLSLEFDASLVRVLGAASVATTALLPTYLWCAGRVPGVPLYPLFALTFLWAYATPMVSGHPAILAFEDAAILAAALTVAGFLVLGILVWYLVAVSPAPVAHTERVLKESEGRYVFIAMISGAGLLTVGTVGNWLDLGRFFSTVRAILFALASVGLFALSYKWGKRELTPNHRRAFIGASVFYLVAGVSTLLLVNAIVSVGLIVVGYTAGRRHFPWISVLGLVIMFGFLHSGKAAMREEYWGSYAQPLQISNYPDFFAEWFANGIKGMNAAGSDNAPQPLYERVSLVHLLLKVQSESPELVPYLSGATYAIVPQLLIPRIWDPDKLGTHEGTTILNEHYGIQSRDDSETTTIGWGLLNEAYANFGMLGVGGLGLLLGTMYGWVTRKTAGASVLSLRSLVAMTFAALAVQAEFSAGVYASALFQSLIAVFAVGFYLMDRKPVQPVQTKGA